MVYLASKYFKIKELNKITRARGEIFSPFGAPKKLEGGKWLTKYLPGLYQESYQNGNPVLTGTKEPSFPFLIFMENKKADSKSRPPSSFSVRNQYFLLRAASDFFLRLTEGFS